MIHENSWVNTCACVHDSWEINIWYIPRLTLNTHYPQSHRVNSVGKAHTHPADRDPLNQMNLKDIPLLLNLNGLFLSKIECFFPSQCHWFNYSCVSLEIWISIFGYYLIYHWLMSFLYLYAHSSDDEMSYAVFDTGLPMPISLAKLIFLVRIIFGNLIYPPILNVIPLFDTLPSSLLIPSHQSSDSGTIATISAQRSYRLSNAIGYGVLLSARGLYVGWSTSHWNISTWGIIVCVHING